MTHLDTSFVVDLLREQARGTRGPATDWLEGHPDQALAVSVFVACELEAGAVRSTHVRREQQRVRAVLDAVTVVYPDDRFAAHFGAASAGLAWRLLLVVLSRPSVVPRPSPPDHLVGPGPQAGRVA